MKQYKTVQGSTKASYCLVPSHSGVQDFFLLPYTALHSDVSTCRFQRNFSVSKHSTCWYMPVYTGVYQHVPAYTNTYQIVKVCTDSHLHIIFYTSICQYILAYTSTFLYILVYSGMCWYILVCTGMCSYILACTNLDQSSKMVQTRFEPAIFCILLICMTAALREYRHQTPGGYGTL
jgi:hypothetical protein